MSETSGTQTDTPTPTPDAPAREVVTIFDNEADARTERDTRKKENENAGRKTPVNAYLVDLSAYGKGTVYAVHRSPSEAEACVCRAVLGVEAIQLDGKRTPKVQSANDVVNVVTAGLANLTAEEKAKAVEQLKAMLVPDKKKK